MKKFKKFITEEKFIDILSEALSNSTLNSFSNAGPNSGLQRYEIFANKVWGKGDITSHIKNDASTIVVKKVEMGGNIYSSSNPKDKAKFIKDYYETDGKGFKITDPAVSLADLAKTPEYGGKGGGTKVSESTQELLVCCLVLNGYTYDGTDIDAEQASEIIEAAKGEWSKIVGATGKEKLLEQFTENWYDLATSVSSANAILDITGSASKVFWTGQSWDKEIKPYNPDVEGIKDYNSSDMVVLGGDGIYYGFSLKKKPSSKADDPTLINKPITGEKSELKSILSAKGLQNIEDAKVKFFDRIITDYTKFNSGDKKLIGDKGKNIKTLSAKQKGDLIRKVNTDWINDRLRGKGPTKNIFWKTFDVELAKAKDTFCEKFIQLLFRMDLNKLIGKASSQFKFYLLTGIGKQTATGIFVEKAEVKDLPSTIEVLSKVFKAKKLKLGKTLDKKGSPIQQPWEWDGGDDLAAKVRYTIYNGKIPLINLEVRYKGSKTAEPQFQAIATPSFKNLFDH
jgi:hypothetical protein